MNIVLRSQSPEQTMDLGRIFARSLFPGDILAFWGELGAGKTCFIQGICRGLGVSEKVYITSPTFVIINRYQGRWPIYHFDFYRLSCQDEIIELGYEEFFFGQGVCLIEWADRAEELLPDEHVRILMQVISPTERRVEISAYGHNCEKRLAEMDRQWRDVCKQNF